MNKISYLCMLVILISGCNTSQDSYQGVLNYHNERFILQGHDEQGEYTVDEPIGTVTNRVKPSVTPSNHLWSNYLDKGTELFSSKEDQSVILVKHNEQIEVLQKETYN
ncbi:MAG: hypothetical protein ABS949_11055 [Solibacillus sp.]